MAAVIETRGLTKRYGQRLAVAELDLTVEEGTVYGFVGPNGAGKTTTMRMLATLLEPTAGEAWVAGHSVLKDPRAVRKAIGYMPDFFGFYGEMRVEEYLDFFAACYEIPPAVRSRLVDDLLELVELGHRREDYVDSLSRGMKQRLCLARALVHDPYVLILDEPASGLDPRARVEMRELIRELRAMGKTIFVSSHILSEIEEVCTHVGIIEAGRLVVSGPLTEMRRLLQPYRLVRIGLADGRTERAQEWLAGQQGVQEVLTVGGNGDLRVVFSGDDNALAGLLAAMTAAGFAVIRFHEEEENLEGMFLRLTKGVVS